jgi:hypothetical protein
MSHKLQQSLSLIVTTLLSIIFFAYYAYSKRWLSLSAITATPSALLLAAIAWKCYIYPHCFSPLRKLPGPTGGHWFLGQLLNITGEDIGVTCHRW